MLIAKIDGGLGNQMFIYATAFALANEAKTGMILDDVNYTFGGYREFGLNKYNITYNKQILNIPYREGRLRKIVPFIFYKLKDAGYRSVVIKETTPKKMQKFDISPEKNYRIEGFWQTHGYFDMYREQLKKEFSLKSPTPEATKAEEIISGGNYCAMHIRRGDYATFGKGGSILGEEYYKKAMSRIREKKPETKFLVFTDETEYCKKSFKDIENIEYIADFGKFMDYEEIYLMSKCEDFIIANSTFSWWGAYLGYNSGSTVICPVVGKWQADFYPDEWEKEIGSILNK